MLPSDIFWDRINGGYCEGAGLYVFSSSYCWEILFWYWLIPLAWYSAEVWMLDTDTSIYCVAGCTRVDLLHPSYFRHSEFVIKVFSHFKDSHIFYQLLSC